MLTLNKIATWHSLRRARIALSLIEREHKVKGVFTTPDAALIDMSHGQPLFVADDMMRDRSLHHVLEKLGALPMGKAFTNCNVRCWINRVTNQIVIFDARGDELPEWADPCNTNAAPLPLRGDTFMIPSHNMYVLDRMVHNNICCDRTSIPIVGWQHKQYYSHIHSRTHVTVSHPVYRTAWIYFARPDVINIDGATWEPMTWFTYKGRMGKPKRYSYYNPDTLGRKS